jgi:Domain of unknown function (DUF5753)
VVARSGRVGRTAGTACCRGQRPTVTLGVVPDTAPVVPWHNFVIHEPADGQPIYVTTETVHGELAVREAADVAIYLKLWDQLRQLSVVGEDAAEWIRKLP